MVEMSPNCSRSPQAILASIRRIILPDLVFGNARTFIIKSGVATGPISFRTK